MSVESDARIMLMGDVDPLSRAEGDIAGQSVVTIFGRNPDIDAASGIETVWNGGGLYKGQDATVKELLEFVSSSADDSAAGIGARTIRVKSLTDGVVGFETITLNGLAYVSSSVLSERVIEAEVMTVGSSKANVGAITCRQKTTTANTMFVMPAGMNHTAVCAYTIPAGYTGYLRKWNGSIWCATASNAEFRLCKRVNMARAWTVIDIGGVSLGDQLERDWPNYHDEPLVAGTDIRVDVDVDANNTQAYSTFQIVLVAD